MKTLIFVANNFDELIAKTKTKIDDKALELLEEALDKLCGLGIVLKQDFQYSLNPILVKQPQVD